MTTFYDSEYVLSALWRATWQAALLAAIVYALILGGKRWMAPRWRTLLWAVPLLRLLLLVAPATSWSLYHWVEPAEAVEKTAHREPATVSPPIRMSQPQLISPTADMRLAEQNADPVVPLAAASEARRPQKSIATALPKTSDWLMLIWGIGVAAVSLRWIAAQIALRRLVANSEFAQDPALLEQIERERRGAGVRRRVRCRLTGAELGPATCGLLRPTILLPSRLLDELNERQIRSIIRHEVEHIRRWDALLTLLARAVTALHWFNPLAYLLSRRLQQEIELSVDAATTADLAIPARQAYGALLIQLAQRQVRPMLINQMADGRSNVRVRINELASPVREGRLRSGVILCLLLLLIAGGVTDRGLSIAEEPAAEEPAPAKSANKQVGGQQQNQQQPSAKYYVTGIARDETTGKPVAGAEIKILVATERDLDKRILLGKTDAEGQYKIAVPLGQVQLWFPRLKPGYWLTHEFNTKTLVTSPDKPIANCDLPMKTGPVWKVQVFGDPATRADHHAAINEIPDKSKRLAWLKGEPVSWQKPPEMWNGRLNTDGTGWLTEVGTSREFVIAIGSVMGELVVEKAFDNTRVISAEPDGELAGVAPEHNKRIKLTDHAGHTATVTGFDVSLRDGIPLLTTRLKNRKLLGEQNIQGKVVDAKQQPIRGAKVGLASGRKDAGSGMSQISTISDERGEFNLNVKQYEAHQPGLQYSVVVTKDGFAGRDSRPFDVKKGFPTIDVGTIALQPGHAARVRVLDEQGRPAAGAVLEPRGGYAIRAQAVRADAEGIALLKNLPKGLVRVSVRLGNLFKQDSLVVSADPSQDVATIRLKTISSAPWPEFTPPQPLPVGKPAPALQVRIWSDGQSRSLADFKGKTVVLDFWGVWCSPCITTIPALQELAEKYQKRDVVFLSVHTPDGEASTINKLKKLKGWTAPSAIDLGINSNDGATCKAYGISGYPTLVIVNPAGKIAFRSDVMPPGIEDQEEMIALQKKTAAENGLQWPAEDATNEEVATFANRLQVIIMTQQLDRILKD